MTKCPLSKYSSLFGEPGKGIHKIRILNTPILDYLLTILAAMLISYLTDIPLVLTTIFMFVFGIFIHMLFGVNTSSVEYLGLSC